MAKAVEIVRSGRLGRVVAVVGTAMYHKPDSYFEEGPWGAVGNGGLSCFMGEAWGLPSLRPF